MIRLTVEQVIENNKRIIEENNLKTWDEIHAFTLKTRLVCSKCADLHNKLTKGE